MGCLAKFSKFLIVMLNLVMVIGVVGACVIFFLKYKPTVAQILAGVSSYYKLITYSTIGIVFLVVLVVVGSISLIGVAYCFVGNSGCYRFFYLFLFIFAFAVEAVGVYFGILDTESVTASIGANWNNDNYRNATKAFEQVYECCGYQGQSDDCGCSSCSTTCYSEFGSQMTYAGKLLGMTSAALLAAQFILLFFASYLACCNKDGLNPTPTTVQRGNGAGVRTGTALASIGGANAGKTPFDTFNTGFSERKANVSGFGDSFAERRISYYDLRSGTDERRSSLDDRRSVDERRSSLDDRRSVSERKNSLDDRRSVSERKNSLDDRRSVSERKDSLDDRRSVGDRRNASGAIGTRVPGRSAARAAESIAKGESKAPTKSGSKPPVKGEPQAPTKTGSQAPVKTGSQDPTKGKTKTTGEGEFPVFGENRKRKRNRTRGLV